MKSLAIKLYIQIIELMQRGLIGISNVALTLYGPLPSAALKARLSLLDMKK